MKEERCLGPAWIEILSREIAQRLRSKQFPGSVWSLSLRRQHPWYFNEEIYYTDQITEKVFAYSFWVELTLQDGQLKATFLRNDYDDIPYRPIKPGVDEPNAPLTIIWI